MGTLKTLIKDRLPDNERAFSVLLLANGLATMIILSGSLAGIVSECVSTALELFIR